MEIEDAHKVNLTVAEVRAMFDAEGECEALDTALDEAQGEVFSGEHDVAYILIKITP
jgi:hypothetical protein